MNQTDIKISVDEIISQIRVVFRQINSDGRSQNTIGLLECANKLASLRYNLADLWVDAKLTAEQQEADYKNKVDQRFMGLRIKGKTIEEAKAQARQEYSVDYSAFLQADREKNKLAALRDDLATKISVLQSYASELRSQKNFGGL